MLSPQASPLQALAALGRDLLPGYRLGRPRSPFAMPVWVEEVQA